ncbi:hypothetical protein NG819_03605 [Pseudarthrobacter sp. Fe7]|nr:hypothetical protein NG819_03605 [Pseudarthrobacter sp. Fe7]
MLLNGLHQRSASRTIIVIDDADQLDPSSQAIIGFLARRLIGSDIVLFVGLRDLLPESPFSSLPALRLGTLGYSDTVRMLERVAPKQPTTATSHAVAAATEGNPLAAVELYAHLMERHVEGKYALPIPLPSQGSFDAEYAAMVGALSDGARNVLDLLALSFRSDISTIEKIDGEVWSSVDELLTAGLVKRAGPHIGIGDQAPPGIRLLGHDACGPNSQPSGPRRCRNRERPLRPQMAFELHRLGTADPLSAAPARRGSYPWGRDSLRGGVHRTCPGHKPLGSGNGGTPHQRC